MMPTRLQPLPLRATWIAVGLLAVFGSSAQAQIEFLEKDPGTNGPIKIEAYLGPEKVRAGEIARGQVEVEIASPWYIYALRPDPGGGPPTRMALVGWDGKTNGRINENRPDEERDPETGGFIRVHKKRARFWTDVKFPFEMPPGKIAIQGTLTYAACNGKICLPPRVAEFVAEGTLEPGHSRQNTDPLLQGER